MNLNRLENLIGKESIEKVKNLNILILGLGGVGGYVVESLARCGVSEFTLVDNDVINTSNINRQIIATSKNNNKYKTKEWKKRIKLINKEAKVDLINAHISEENLFLLFTKNYDYIVDACDSTQTKIDLIKECLKQNIKIISCMGTANKLDATKLEITTLDKTNYDPLAKKIRKEFSRNKKDMKKIVVVSSTEKTIKSSFLGSTSYVPAVAGLYVTNYIINDIINKEE